MDSQQHELDESDLADIAAWTSRPLDTSPEAAAIYWKILRSLSVEQRLEMGFQMSDRGRDMCEAGVRQRHPDYTDEQVQRAVLLLMQGREIYQQCYPDHDIEP